MHKIFDIIPAVAESNATVLIEGPTGSGKDLMARVIHTASQRKDKPLVKVNCAALPDNLLESEMFGYVKGAFTGAERDKPGRFQDADGKRHVVLLRPVIQLLPPGTRSLYCQGHNILLLERRGFLRELC